MASYQVGPGSVLNDFPHRGQTVGSRSLPSFRRFSSIYQHQLFQAYHKSTTPATILIYVSQTAQNRPCPALFTIEFILAFRPVTTQTYQRAGSTKTATRRVDITISSGRAGFFIFISPRPAP